MKQQQLKESFTLTVYRLDGDHAIKLRETGLTVDRESAWRALLMVREGLPGDCGASLTDSRGNSVRHP